MLYLLVKLLLKASQLQSKPEGINYDYDQCDGIFTRQDGLTIHKQSRHKEIIYYCAPCNNSFTKHYGLTIHKQYKHVKLVSQTKVTSPITGNTNMKE